MTKSDKALYAFVLKRLLYLSCKLICLTISLLLLAFVAFFALGL